MRKGAKFAKISIAKIYITRFYPALINPHKVYSLNLKFSGCPGNGLFSGIIILLYERNCKYTRFVCFDRWLLRHDHISTKKLLLYYWKSVFKGCLYYLSVHFHSSCFYDNIKTCRSLKRRTILKIPSKIFLNKPMLFLLALKWNL